MPQQNICFVKKIKTQLHGISVIKSQEVFFDKSCSEKKLDIELVL